MDSSKRDFQATPKKRGRAARRYNGGVIAKDAIPQARRGGSVRTRLAACGIGFKAVLGGLFTILFGFLLTSDSKLGWYPPTVFIGVGVLLVVGGGTVLLASNRPQTGTIRRLAWKRILSRRTADPNAGDPEPRKMRGQMHAMWGERLQQLPDKVTY